MAATLKVYKRDARNVCVRLVKVLVNKKLVLTLSLSRHSPIVSFSVICCMASGLEQVNFLQNLGLPVPLHT